MMDDLTNNELARELSDARERAQIFLTRSLTSVTKVSQDYNMDLHKAHAAKAGKLLAELIRRTGN